MIERALLLRPLRKTLGGLTFALQNRSRLARLQRSRGLQLHLGCGDERLPDFMNIDARRTAATDIVMDLSDPQLTPASAAAVFSHAFFEHLYRDARVPHLKRVFDALQPTGECCYLGLPYFPNIARFYLDGAPGIVGPRFDLYNVYRYTHGDPEQSGSAGWWLEQLHKSLFDEEELTRVVLAAGFPSAVQFSYAYPGEGLAVSMGFFGSRDVRTPDRLRTACRAFLSRFDGRKIRLETLEWLPDIVEIPRERDRQSAS